MKMDKPDFSGRWRFNPQRSTLQITAPDSTEIMIDHREPEFRLSRTHTIGGRKDVFSIALTTDGREVTVRQDDLDVRAHAFWEGDHLVFSSSVSRGGSTGTNVVIYSLGASPDTLIAEESFRSSALNYDNTWVLDRVGPLAEDSPVTRPTDS